MHELQLRMFLAAAGFLACYHGANAKVTRLEIVRTVPYGSFLAGDYVRLDGRVVGELAPDETFLELTTSRSMLGVVSNTRRQSPSLRQRMPTAEMEL